MNTELLEKYRTQFQTELFDHVLPFWMDTPLDHKHGGYYSYIALDGTVYNTDKSVWIQGRALWLFSYLCNRYGMRDEWIHIATSCKKFLDDYCFDSDGRMFFMVTEDGRPLRKRRYWFSETFYIIGCAEYAISTGSKQALEDARKVYDMVCRIYDDPSTDPFYMPPKYYSDVRPTKGLAYPMIMLNVTSIMRRCDPEHADIYDARSKILLHNVTTDFYHEELDCFFETVTADGKFMDNTMGRTINPGHALEASWFMIQEANYFHDPEIIRKALNIYKWSLERGWDKEYGGIYYFVDVKGYPCEQYEQDLKLWWPVNEAVIASLTAYKVTGKEEYFDWFEKLTDYAFSHFPDHKFGGWIGYLIRTGQWQMPPTKGNGYKSCFHEIRMLVECDHLLLDLIEKSKN